MPSQRPVTVPPYAILDPDFCSEWGRPLFAWHANIGRISAGGGGMAYSLGSIRGLRGAASGSGVVRSGGGVNFSGGAPFIDFGSAIALRMTTAYTMFVQAKPVNATTTTAMIGNTGVSSANGIDLGTSSAGKILARCSAGASVRFISAEAYDATLQTFMCAVRPGPSGAWLGVYRNGAALTNGSGDAAPTTPTFSNGWFLSGSLASPFLGTIYSAVMWSRPQPQRLAELLDQDPARLWWWPGKNRNRTFSIPGASIVSAGAGLTGVGSLSASALDLILAGAGLVSAGTLAGSGLDIILAGAGLSGVGSFADSALVIVSGSLNLAGIGLLTASGIIVGGGVLTDSAGLISVGVLSANGQVVVIGQASIAGASVVSASQNVIIGTGAVLIADSVMSAVGLSATPLISINIIIMGEGSFADRMTMGSYIDREIENSSAKMLQGSYIDRETETSNIKIIEGSGRA